VPHHRPHSATAVALLVAWCAAGCADIDVADDLPPATLAEPYEAALSITGARGSALVDLYSGALPDGLTLDGDGTLHGTPVGIGPYPFTVRVVDSVSRWVLAPLTLEVTASADQIYLGPVLTAEDMNRLCLDGVELPDLGEVHYMCLPWVRIDGGGMAGQTERPLRAGVLWVGPDGEAAGGWGDDVLLRELASDELAWSFQPGISIPLYDLDGPNSPTDTTVSADGTLIGGQHTGPGEVLVSHPTYGDGAIEVLVVPPDFCPSPSGC